MSGLPDPLAPAGFAVDEHEDGGNLRSVGLHYGEGFEGAPAGGEGVLDHDDPSVSRQAALDPAAGAVSLLPLSHREGLHGCPFDPAPMRHRVGDRVRSEGQATNPAGEGSRRPQRLESHHSEEELALSGHGHSARIDVVGRTLAAGEGKIAQFKRALDQKGPEASSVIHPQELPVPGQSVKGRPFAAALAVLLLATSLAACEESSTQPGEPRFGQQGRIQVEVSSAIAEGQGELNESLIWNSNGPWVLAERVSYRRILGGEHVRRSERNPGQLAQEYATFLRELHEAAEFRLLDGDLPQDLQPTCAPSQSRVTFVIRDDQRGESVRWVRCASGTLFELTPAEAGPDEGASRVAAAGRSLRLLTLGVERESVYDGTLPYATLDRGADSPASPENPRVFLSFTGEPPQTFREFWAEHAGEEALLPNVDWGSEAVVLAAVGERQEAGEAVEVRRVLPQQGFSTLVEVVQRVRGNFCAPAATRGFPYHIVVVPVVALPIEFVQPRVERVSCGF